ncbi:MAG: peptidase M28, partial [Gemmatimonadota bacterium]
MPALRPSRPILAVVTILPLLLPGAQVHAQQVGLPAPVRAAADAITPERIRSDLEFLSSDALRGRFTPSPGYDSAAAFIARRLERAGLKPLGDDGTYFQHYDLREERLDTAAAYLEIGGRRFDFGDDFLMRSFAGPLDGTLPVVYVGHGWTVPGEGIDPYAGVDV